MRKILMASIVCTLIGCLDRTPNVQNNYSSSSADTTPPYSLEPSSSDNPTTDSNNILVSSSAFSQSSQALFSSSSSMQSHSQVLRILPFGDSQTAGFTDAPTWSIPFTFGYRGPLYTLLKDNGYNFNFVGNSFEPLSLPFGEALGAPADSNILGPNLTQLGQDSHSGYGGATTSQLLYGGVVQGSVDTFPSAAKIITDTKPDIVLLMVGTNGIEDGISTIDSLVYMIVSTQPSVYLIVAQITPRATFKSLELTYNDLIKSTVLKYASKGFRVYTVDQYANFITDANDPTSIDLTLLCPDGVHLRPEANRRVAKTWFNAINSLGL